MSRLDTAGASLDAKVIAASNLAVAHALMELALVQRGGQPAIPHDRKLVGLFKSYIQQVDKMLTTDNHTASEAAR